MADSLDTINPTTAWNETLAALGRQTTRATYESNLRNTYVAHVDGRTWTIAAATAAAQEWLQNRLYETVRRTLAGVLGYIPEDLILKFTVASGQVPASNPGLADLPAVDLLPGDFMPEARPETPGQRLAKADFYHAFFRGDKDRPAAGFALVSHYASQFWAPYLDRAFLLWKRLDSDSRTGIDQIKNRWSEPAIITYNSLKDALNYPHIRNVCGARMECTRSLDAIRFTGEQIERCCMKYSPIRTKTDRQGRERCFHWYVGQLEVLYNEALLAIAVERRGDHPRSQTTRAQIWRLLPILTPHQVGQLNGELQKDHAQWLSDFGHLFDIDLATWRLITEKSLVPFLAGYQEYRQLQDPYIFAAKFLALPCRHRIGFTTLESQNPESFTTLKS